MTTCYFGAFRVCTHTITPLRHTTSIRRYVIIIIIALFGTRRTMDIWTGQYAINYRPIEHFIIRARAVYLLPSVERGACVVQTTGVNWYNWFSLERRGQTCTSRRRLVDERARWHAHTTQTNVATRIRLRYYNTLHYYIMRAYTHVKTCPR